MGNKKEKALALEEKYIGSPYCHIGIERAIVGFGEKFLLGRFAGITKPVIYFLQRCEALALYF